MDSITVNRPIYCSVHRFDKLSEEHLCSKGPTGTDGGPGAKGPVVNTQLFNLNNIYIYYMDALKSDIHGWLFTG